MTEWNFDITAIPRGRNEPRSRTIKVKGVDQEQQYTEFVPEKVWIAHPTDGKVYLTHCLANGRWSGWSAKEEPIAFQAFVRPVHPHSVKQEA